MGAASQCNTNQSPGEGQLLHLHPFLQFQIAVVAHIFHNFLN